MEFNLIATTTFGLESVTAKELKKLGYEDLKVENGKVSFKGDEMDIAICNIWLRTAERILIEMASFTAQSFEELFQGTLNVNWSEIIPQNGIMHVNGKSVKSQLHSVPDCQSIVKKAIIESMKRSYGIDFFPEDGSYFKIEVGILKDLVTLTIDTSGQGLHKRGYRENSGEAPIKETLAAALVLLSDWNHEELLVDPLCGSGTIAIEAALIAKNSAPGLNRSFVSETWEFMSKDVFSQVRNGARASISKKEVSIYASDIDGRVIRTAKNNAIKAGVDDCIFFQRIPLQEFSSKKKNGCIITNPPYGERLGELSEVEDLTRVLHEKYTNLDNWSLFVISAFTDFEKVFGIKADKNRKLYNGRLLCYYYQYLKNKH